MSALPGMICRYNRAHLVETGHGLISAADLDLVESSLSPFARSGRALDSSLVGVGPGFRTAEDIFSLLLLEVPARIHGLLNSVLVGTCSTLKPVAAVLWRSRDGQDIAALGTDYSNISWAFSSCARTGGVLQSSIVVVDNGNS